MRFSLIGLRRHQHCPHLDFGFPDSRTVRQCIFVVKTTQLVITATPGNQYCQSESNFSIQLRLLSSMKAAQKSDGLELGSVIWGSYVISRRLFPHM